MINSSYKEWYDKFRLSLDAIGSYFEEDDISLNCIEIGSNIIKLWENEIYKLLKLARIISLNHLTIRNDVSEIHHSLIELYRYRKEMPIVARPDTIIVGGIPKILELNYDSSSIEGIFEIDYIQSLFLNSPFFGSSNKEFLSGQKEFTNFINSVFAELDIESNNKTMALLIYNNMSQYDKDVTHSISKWINNNTDIKCLVKMHEALYVHNGMITDGENNFDLLYIYSTLIDIPENTKSLEGLLLQSVYTKCVFISDPRDLAVDCKLSLALMYESTFNKNSDISNYLVKLIKKYIPWTIIVEDNKQVMYYGSKYNLIKLLKSKQNNFILKKTNSYYGKHVIIGRKVDYDIWNERILRILNSKEEIWVVQEHLESDIHNFVYYDSVSEKIFSENRHYVLSPYFLGSKISSFLVRVEKYKEFPILSRHTDGNMGVALVNIYRDSK